MTTSMHNKPDPRDVFLAALDPIGEVDYGLAVTIAHDLSGDVLTVLSELVHKRVARATADAYERGWREGRTP
ncbi:MAG: hypothetical protein ACRDWI_06525 [Jiangellaceae bacterium]